nr:hypothetical protein [Mycobacterium pseudoshottsii]
MAVHTVEAGAVHVAHRQRRLGQTLANGTSAAKTLALEFYWLTEHRRQKYGFR